MPTSYLLEKQTQVTDNIILKNMQCRKLLKPYKHTKTTILLAAHKKQQLLELQI